MGYAKLCELFDGRLPAPPIAPEHRLRGLIRKNLPRSPKVKIACSVVLDQNCYQILKRVWQSKT